MTMVVLGAGCAGTQSERFQPTERATATAETGQTAAEYDLGVAGDAKVWSKGAYEADVNGQRRTVVHTGLQVENRTAAPMHIDDMRVTAVRAGDRQITEVMPLRLSGDRTIPANDEGQIEVLFVLPPEIDDPQEVDSFRVRWALGGENVAYRQTTPFLEEEDPEVRYPDPYFFSPYYDPWFYPGPRHYYIP
jgi:hypothetical protein